MYLRVNIEAMSDGVLVPVIRRMVSSMLKELGADDSTQDRAKLVVTEACSNVVRHAYDTPATYEVTLEYSAEMMRISVRDHGKGFDPATVPEPSPEEERLGGFGIKFIHTPEQALLQVDAVVTRPACHR